jgi:5-methylcytosine-specific restriction endonuclease McrA
MKRKRLSPKARASILERQAGLCAICARPGQRWEFDHEIQLAIGGADAVENLRALCRACHAEKTAKDATIRAKVKRLIRTRTGERSRARKGPPLRSKPFAAWRGLDGTIRKREER